MRAFRPAVAAACLAHALAASAESANPAPEVVASPLPLTGPEVARHCARVAPCKDALGKVGKFCGLAEAGEDRKPWLKLAVPTRAELEAAKCPAGVKGGGPTAAFGTRGLGLDQSAILWGATDFLVSRAEQELRDWAIDRFLDSVCDDGKYAKLGGEPIFPNSCPVARGAHLAGFLTGMATYQLAMKKDLTHLPVLVGKQLVAKAPEARKDPAVVALELSHALEHVVSGAPPLPSLRYAAIDLTGVQLDCATLPVASRLYQAAALLASMPVTRKGIDLPGDAEAWAYTFMALAVNATDPASGIQKAWPKSCLEQKQIGPGAAPFDLDMVLRAKDIIERVVDEMAKEAQKLENLPAGDAAARIQAYGKFTTLVVASAEELLAMDPDLDTRRPELGVVLRAFEELSRDVGAGNYASAALTLSGMAAFVAPKVVTLPPEVLRVVAFGVDVAQARDADSAAAAINRFAAPPGGYRGKRQGGGYARLNAYLGLYAAAEKAEQAAPGWSHAKWGFSGGFFAPIGVEMGSGLNGAGSLGVLLFPVDLGVLASWRVSNDSLATQPVVGWEQVFAPGAALVYGIPGAPLSVAATFELAPKLRSLQPEVVSQERNAFRAGLSIAVDIPLFP